MHTTDKSNYPITVMQEYHIIQSNQSEFFYQLHIFHITQSDQLEFFLPFYIFYITQIDHRTHYIFTITKHIHN